MALSLWRPGTLLWLARHTQLPGLPILQLRRPEHLGGRWRVHARLFRVCLFQSGRQHEASLIKHNSNAV